MIEDDPADFHAMLEQGESAFRIQKTFDQAAERVTFLYDAAQLETTAQTSTPVKMRDTSYGKRKNMGEEPFLESD